MHVGQLANNKMNSTLHVSDAKHLHEMINIDKPTEYLLLGKVIDIKYAIYEVIIHKIKSKKTNLYLFQACPLINEKTKMYCGKKLYEQRHCASCDRIVRTPQLKLYAFIWIQDLQQPELRKVVAAFHYAAEAFLGLKVHQMQGMKDEELYKILCTKLDIAGLFKIKAKVGKTFYCFITLFSFSNTPTNPSSEILWIGDYSVFVLSPKMNLKSSKGKKKNRKKKNPNQRRPRRPRKMMSE